MLGWVKRRPAIQVVQRASDFRPCKYHAPYPRAELANHKGSSKGLVDLHSCIFILKVADLSREPSSWTW
jgi:hypothetical protein